MILLNNNFEQQVESIKTNPNGNYIILNMTIQGKKVTLVNIYGPNEDNPQFYRNLKEKYSEFDNEILIICGDWNWISYRIRKLTITTICILITLVSER